MYKKSRNLYILGNHDTYHTEDKSRNMNAIVKNLESENNIYLLDKDYVYEYYNILFLSRVF